MASFAIRAAHGAELVAGSRLLADSLGFEARDAIPPWLMQTGVAAGGLALGAFAGERLAGFSFALPAEDGTLFSCGLAVAPEARGGGVARRLKLAQREWALERGVERIRWTAEPLSAVALTLYLSGLGARLASYEPELYADVRPARVPPDDVVIDWDLRAGPRPVAPEERRVEIPLDHRALEPCDLGAWRRRVRGEMCRALDAGLTGTAVALDRGARRAWVLFQPVAAA